MAYMVCGNQVCFIEDQYMSPTCSTMTMTGGSSSNCINNVVWINWTTTGNGTGDINNIIWPRWITNFTISNHQCATYTSQTNIVSQMPQLTEEEIAARNAAAEEYRVRCEAEREERRVKAEEAVKQRKAAEAKAMELLRENLSDGQRKALDKHGWFLVEGGKSKKIYRIKKDSYQGNIYEMEGKKEMVKLCVHALSSIPLGDHLLAQAMSLRWDEDHIVGTANKTRLAA